MNKFTLILVAAVFLIAGRVHAGGEGGLGIKGGINLTSVGLDNDNAEDLSSNMRVAGTAGFGYEAATDGFFAFEIEMLYAMVGTKQEATFAGNRLKNKNSLHYLRLPASFKFYIGDNFNVHAGGFIGFALGGKSRFTTFNSDGSLIGDETVRLSGKDPQGDRYLSRYDGGALVGVEFVSDKGIGVGARLTQGFVDITNDDFQNILVSGKGRALTTDIAIYATFRF